MMSSLATPLNDDIALTNTHAPTTTHHLSSNTPLNMINAALIGLGWWGKNHLAAAQGKSTKLRFVHGVSKEIDAALPLAEAHGFTLSDDLEHALADPRVQAVVLATPHSLHTEQIVRTAGAGKAVFCEKAFA